MTSTFTRLAGWAGFAGSIVLAALIVAPALFPTNDFLQAPFYGGGALLLAVFGAGLYRAGAGQTGIAGKIGLVIAIASFLSIAVLAMLDVVTRLGWGNYEWLWPVLIISAGLMFGGLAVYAAGAMMTRTIPVWIDIPLATGGTAFVVVLIATIVMGDRRTDAISETVNTAAFVAMALVTAAVALLGVMLALGRVPDPQASPRSLPRPST